MKSWLWLLGVILTACAADTPAQRGSAASLAHARAHADAYEDRCVTLLCGVRACGLYRCEDVRPGRIVRAQAVAPPPLPEPAVEPFPTTATPQRYWGNAQGLPGDAQPIFIIPWNQNQSTSAAEALDDEDGAKDKRTYVKHHVFPREFQKRFVRKGIDIHDWTMVLEESTHLRIHSGAKGGPWNAAWRAYFDEEGKNASKQAIHVFALKLILRFELSGPVVAYRHKMHPVIPVDAEDPY